MLIGEKKFQNICVRNLEGAIYTVDEVSDLLGIPRPTLYRYLREYSIPHIRKAGRISIPEDSFDRIREARDLHREGLGTESVRRQLREGSAPDTGELDRRLDSLHKTLESLKGDIKERPATTDEVALSPTLRTILARQSLLMSAMFNLTEMVEDLLLASGKRRKPLFEDLGMRDPLSESPTRDQLEIAGTVPANAVSGAVQASQPLAARSASFGALGRRRRRGVLAVLAVLLFAVCLAWALPALIGNSEPSVPRVTKAADEPPGNPKAMAAPGETTSTDQTTAQEPAQESNVKVAAGGSKPEEGEVPDVSGQSLEEAAGVISDAGFEIAAIKTEASQEEPETIIGTKPSAGASAKPGAPVILTMSGGPTGIPPGVQTTSASANASTSASVGATASATASASASAR